MTTPLSIAPELLGTNFAAWLCRLGNELLDPITGARHTDPDQLSTRTFDACLVYVRANGGGLAFYARNLDLPPVHLVISGQDLVLLPDTSLTQEQAQAIVDEAARLVRSLQRRRKADLTTQTTQLSTQAESLEPSLTTLTTLTTQHKEELDDDHLVPPPVPDDTALYGLIGDLGRAAATNTEVNPFAAAAAFMSFLSAQVGRDVYLPVGNTYHHCRLYTLHVGRSGEGRKGDALGLIHRVRHRLAELYPDLVSQVHTGGLSSREGLTLFIHDGYKNGKEIIPAIEDKRLWIVETEFANILQQSKREGNTLSAALRDAWDGVAIKPATKTNRIGASNPPLALSAGVTPMELLELITSRELSNGFAGRFLIFQAERLQMVAMPASTADEDVAELANRTAKVIQFAKGDYPKSSNGRRISLSPQASRLYTSLYYDQLNHKEASDLLSTLLVRRSAAVIRIAMLMALTELALLITPNHLYAAHAWIRFWEDSVRYLFPPSLATGKQQAIQQSILEYLQQKGETSRNNLRRDCFNDHLPADQLDKALSSLLNDHAIELLERARADGKPGRGSRIYRIPEQQCVVSVVSVVRRGTKADQGMQPSGVSVVSYVSQCSTAALMPLGGNGVSGSESQPRVTTAPGSLGDLVQQHRARWQAATTDPRCGACAHFRNDASPLGTCALHHWTISPLSLPAKLTCGDFTPAER